MFILFYVLCYVIVMSWCGMVCYEHYNVIVWFGMAWHMLCGVIVLWHGTIFYFRLYIVMWYVCFPGTQGAGNLCNCCAVMLTFVHQIKYEFQTFILSPLRGFNLTLIWLK